MSFRNAVAATLSVAAVALVAYAPAAKADRVGFNVTFGGPGYGVTVGNGYGYGFVPAPVVIAAPAVPYYYRSYRPHVVAPVVVAPAYRTYYRPYPVHRYDARVRAHKRERYHGHR